MDLNVYRWKNRLLILFSSSQDDPNYQALSKEMQDQRIGLKDRDMLVFEVFEKGKSRLGDSSLKKDSAEILRKQFGIRQGQFCVVLIGKDGEEKRRWESKVGLVEIFSIVDAMPMRQREMREGSKNKQ